MAISSSEERERGNERSKRGQEKRDVIIRALGQAGEGLRFMRLWEKVKDVFGGEEKKSDFAYHLKQLVNTEKVVTEYQGNTRLYKLAPKEANRSDIKFSLAMIEQMEDTEAQEIAAQQFKEICRETKISTEALRDTIIPFVKRSLTEDRYRSVRFDLLASLNWIIKNTRDLSVKHEIKEDLFETLMQLLSNKSGDSSVRYQATMLVISLAKSEADMNSLFEKFRELVHDSDEGYKAVAVHIISRLENAPANFREKIRDLLFALLLDEDGKVKARVKEWVPRFREAEPPTADQIVEI